MSNTKTRLNILEKKLDKRDQEISIYTILKIDRLIYCFHDKPISEERRITMQEWEAYRANLLRNGEDKEHTLRRLARNEEYLKKHDAFIKDHEEENNYEM